jgi:predicted nucleotidyltransferase
MNIEKTKRYHFKKLFDVPYPIEHVYPIKQKDIVTILSQLPSSIQKVYLFGSCLTLHCGQESDIDLLVIGTRSDEEYKAFSLIFKQLDNEVDLIIKTSEEFQEGLSVGGSICDVVNKEGLVLYERPIYTR